MSLMDKLKGEFVDIIEWVDDSSDTLVWKFPRFQDEIKSGAQLTVRPGQIAVFVNHGKIAETFGPGMHTLTTRNLPILSSLQGLKFGFDSPFKAEVYFVSTRQFTDQKWGTKSPVILRDAEFGVVRLRAFGTYVLRVADPIKLIAELTGSNTRFFVDEISEQLRSLLLSRFSDVLATAKIPMLDLATHYDDLAIELSKQLQNEFAPFGLETPNVVIENITLPEEVERMLDKRTGMGVVGNLDQFAKFQAANALEAAANNPGGMAAGMIGVGIASTLPGQMAASAPSASPPPIPPTSTKEWWIALSGQQNGPHDLNNLRLLFAQGAISNDTLAWKPGLASWNSISQIPELKVL